jgi:LemA protein
MLTSGLKSVFALSENYPDLKASQNFIALQNDWSNIENSIQAARRAYNAAAKELKDKKEMFPSSIVAGVINLKEYAMFAAQEEAKTAPSAKALFNA